MTSLVTGAFGCIGSWVVRKLVDAGERTVLYELADDPWRLRMIAGPDIGDRVRIVRGDITDREGLLRVVGEHEIRRLIHLAAWQVPLCRQDPSRGALVNVVGTVNVFEAARAHRGQIERVVYLSSAGVFGPPAIYPPGPLADDAPPRPATHYGVFKVANEETARVYWGEHGLPSSGFRPLSVYGPGRDFGVTAAPTLAMKAAVLNRPYRIPYGGRTDLIFVEDVASAVIAASRATFDGARVYNLHGESLAIADVVRTIHDLWPGSDEVVSHTEEPTPFAEALDDARYQLDFGPTAGTSFKDGARRTLDEFARLRRDGRLDARELG
jgi:nucleoside-diphosphate-sugar epimerase